MIGKGQLPDVPPPGTGLFTQTFATPIAAISAPVIVAVTRVALTNVVDSGLPLKFTSDDDTNPVPFTVSVNAPPPAAAPGRDREVIVGTGLFAVNGEFPDGPPPGAGLVTVTLNVPAVAMSAAVIDAVSCVALTGVVTRALPLKFTTEDA